MNEAIPVATLPKVPYGTAKHITARLVALRRIIESDTSGRGYTFRDIYMYGIDLANAYYQWRVREDQQELTAFWFLSELYVHCGLPFGSKLSPSVFCRFVHLIGRFLEEELGCVLNFYMDDATGMNFPRERAQRDMRVALAVLRWLGLETNLSKCSDDVGRVVEALGLLWDLRAWTVSVRAKTLGKLVARLHLLLAGGVVKRWQGPILALLLERVVGSLNFVQLVIPTVVPIKRRLIQCCRRARALTFYSLPGAVLPLLKRLVGWLEERNSTPIWCPQLELASQHQHYLASDASNWGFSAWGVSAEGVCFYLHGEW